jgi:hypothetical protein
MIASNSALASGVVTTRDWQVNDSLVFGYYYKNEYTEYNKEVGLLRSSLDEGQTDTRLEILAIDEAQKIVFINRTTSNGYSSVLDYDYNGNAYAKEYLTTDRLFYAFYAYDIETEQYYLTSFSISVYNIFYFLEADWGVFNEDFKKVFDDDQVIARIPIPVEHDVTMSEFLESINSYSICGRSSINYARKQFKESRTKWLLEFDLKNTIYIHDNDKDEFLPYSKYKLLFHLEYSEGGTLEKYQFTREYKYETSKKQAEYYQEETFWLGGGNIVPISTEFLLFGFSVVAFIIIRKRKNTRKVI